MDTTKPNSSWLKTFSIGFSIISFGITIAIIGYIILTTKQTQPINQQQVKISPTISAVSPAPNGVGANWKTYRNQEYEFEVKHPNAWAIEAPYIGPDPTGYDFAVQISNVKDPFGIRCGETERETGTNPCLANQAVYIFITDLSLHKKTFQDVIRSSGKSDEQKVVIINGLSFIKVGETSPMYFIENDNIIYSLSFIRSDLIIDQILSTFQFLN